MNAFVKSRESGIQAICRNCNVQRLWLFGSGAGRDFDAAASDLDFVAEFHDMPPEKQSECFFSLIEQLEALFGIPVDLIELEPVTNPFLLKSIIDTRVLIFQAA